jgi:arylsulfatase
MLEGVPKWDELSEEQQKLYARMMETYAGFTSHADEQIGRVVDFLEATGALENTLVFVFVGDNGASGEGTLHGLFNEMTLLTIDPLEVETVEMNLRRIEQLGQPGSYNHYPIGWALAMNTPFKLCKQYTHFGGTRNPLVVHWPKGFKARGELRDQFHHVIDIVPTILAAVGIDAPRVINSQQQEPLEGVPMNYTFDQPKAATTHPTQYFEMLGNRAIVDGRWKAVTYHGCKPWENRAAWSFDDDHWELYDLDADPSECNDLMVGLDLSDRKQPTVKRLLQLIGLWWSEAGRYGVLPLDDRFQERVLDRADLMHDQRTKFTFRPGAIRIPKDAAPNTLNRSWTATAAVNVPTPVCEGPICAMGGDAAGWSLYLKNGIPTFCYNFAGVERTYIRGEQQLAPGPHLIRYEFESLPARASDAGKPVPYGAGGVGRLYVDKRKVAEGEIPRTMAFDYTLDETFDVGCDKGSPVTDEYPPLAAFSGRVAHVTIDISPEVRVDVERHTAAQAHAAMIRQ